MNITNWSVGNGGEECKPEAASKGVTCTGIPNCAAFTTNNSAQLARSNINYEILILKKRTNQLK